MFSRPRPRAALGRPHRRRSTIVSVALALVAGTAPLAGLPAAQAATCLAPYRYASTSDTVYVTAGTATLTDIRAKCPSAPVALVDSATATWQLSADLVVQNGAGLDLKGTAIGGDVNTLRLESSSSGVASQVASITALYGSITIDGVRVTSWDPAAGAPDTDPSVPAGGTRGRAFIRALSVMDGTTPRVSRMDINASDLGYLGYYAAEVYGVAYKARGCGIDTQDVCAQLDVLGSQTDSRFHHNYMGTYTWGAYGMTFSGNEYDNNVSYGLDPHDDSDSLVITGNSFHDNSNHGLICSQRCDHLTITNNESHDNGHTPWVGPHDDDPSDNQVHGIMLHRGVTDSVVSGNRVWNQLNGAGIAVFDSVGNTISNNTVSNNKYGLRFSVGSRDVQVANNSVTDSSAYAVFSYKGTDTSVYTGTSGRPTGVVFDGNTFSGSGSNLLKVTDSDRFTFVNGSVSGPFGGSLRFERSQNNVYDKSVTTPTSAPFNLLGTSALPTSITFQGMKPSDVKVSRDTFSTATFTG